MLFYPLYYDILSQRSLKITQAFYLLLGFAKNQAIYWDSKIRNSVPITEGLDNRDSDNRGYTVYIHTYTHTYYICYELFICMEVFVV